MISWMANTIFIHGRKSVSLSLSLSLSLAKKTNALVAYKLLHKNAKIVIIKKNLFSSILREKKIVSSRRAHQERWRGTFNLPDGKEKGGQNILGLV